jgi:hypothetical protein
LIAVTHWLAYTSAEGTLVASGEFGPSGCGVTSIAIVVSVLGTPLMHLLRLPPSAFGSTRWWGDDANLIIGLAGLNALVWGIALAAAWRFWLKRRQTA